MPLNKIASRVRWTIITVILSTLFLGIWIWALTKHKPVPDQTIIDKKERYQMEADKRLTSAIQSLEEQNRKTIEYLKEQDSSTISQFELTREEISRQLKLQNNANKEKIKNYTSSEVLDAYSSLPVTLAAGN